MAKAKLTDLEKRIKKLIEIDLDVAMQNLIIDNEPEIIRLLQSQLELGKTGEDVPIMLYGEGDYVPSTKAYKKRYGVGIGAITDRITLYMRGAFYERMYMVIQKKQYAILSDVSYFDKIIDRSGPEVMQLSKNNMDELMNNFINPELEKIIVDALNGV